jgi:hypothetical protein
MSRRPARVTQAEISRALRAAAKVSSNMAVEILPDGTIRLTPALPDDPESPKGPPGKEIVL